MVRAATDPPGLRTETTTAYCDMRSDSLEALGEPVLVHAAHALGWSASEGSPLASLTRKPTLM